GTSPTPAAPAPQARRAAGALAWLLLDAWYASLSTSLIFLADQEPYMIDRNAPFAFNATRRRLIQGAALGAATLAAPAIARAQSSPVIRIGFWPVAAGLPFYAALEKGYFKEAGLNVEPLKFAGAQQVMEAMLAG